MHSYVENLIFNRSFRIRTLKLDLKVAIPVPIRGLVNGKMQDSHRWTKAGCEERRCERDSSDSSNLKCIAACNMD
jgi:hypothetical protein